VFFFGRQYCSGSAGLCASAAAAIPDVVGLRYYAAYGHPLHINGSPLVFYHAGVFMINFLASFVYI
jgi:hypothetical protein